MDPKNIKLTLSNFSNGGPAILRDIAPDYAYRDGVRIANEVIGRKVTVIFPGNMYDSLTVKVSDPQDCLTPLLRKATASNPIYVDFDGFEGGFRNSRSPSGVWTTVPYAKAASVHVISSSNYYIDDLIE